MPEPLRIGLISDTHFNDRLFALPDNLKSLWGQVDLILHAGDVGDLIVLDQLGAIAPVIAVQGNDEPDSVRLALPLRQIVVVRGVRILLWHSHYTDTTEEHAHRLGTWEGVLRRITAQARAVGAGVALFGHTHVPLIYRLDDVLLINPGALTSATYFTRQAFATVARLDVHSQNDLMVTHFDIRTGTAVELPSLDLGEETSQRVSACRGWMLEPDLLPIVKEVIHYHFNDLPAVEHALTPLYRQKQAAGQLFTRQDLVRVFTNAPALDSDDRAWLLSLL